MRVSSYLHRAFVPEEFKRLVKKAVVAIRPHKDEFDAIAVRGTSGLLLGPVVAMALGKRLIVVRKDKGESSHASYQVEAGLTTGKYLIVDDTIATGTTLRAIGKAIKDNHPEMKSNGFVYTWLGGYSSYETRYLKEYM